MMQLDGILGSTDWSRSMNKLRGLDSTFPATVEIKASLDKTLGLLNLTAEFEKKMKRQTALINPATSVLATIPKSSISYSSLVTPSPVYEVMEKIRRQHDLMFGHIRAISPVLSLVASSPVYEAMERMRKQHDLMFGHIRTISQVLMPSLNVGAQFSNWHRALSGISGRITAQAIDDENWSLVDDLNDVAESAVDLADTFSGSNQEERQKQLQIFFNVASAFLSKHKIHGVYVLLIVDIFLRFAGFHQYIVFLRPKPDVATKVEFMQLSNKVDSLLRRKPVRDQKRKSKMASVTNRICAVKLKPSARSYTLVSLPEDFQINVVQICHEWVCISYISPKDSLLEIGWIMKKYLYQGQDCDINAMQEFLD